MYNSASRAQSLPNKQPGRTELFLDFWQDRKSQFVEIIMLVIFVSVNCEAFTLILAYDSQFVHTGSYALTILGLLGDAYSLSMILADKRTRELAKLCYPIWALLIIGFASTFWSIDVTQSLKSLRNFSSPCLLAIAMSGRLGVPKAFKLVVIIMVFLCALSMFWVFAFPGIAVHQQTDIVQSVHAGLWRGVFDHKQRLGMFSGLTVSVASLFGASWGVRTLGALLAAICLVGSESATGFVVASTSAILAIVSFRAVRLKVSSRKKLVTALKFGQLAFALLYNFGALSFLPTLLGKTADLTGRSSFWPYLLSLFASSGRVVLGAGVGNGADFAEVLLGIRIGVDNGYVEKILEFGYAGLLVMILIHLKIWLDGARLIVQATTYESLLCFPFVFISTLFIENITEGLFFKRDIDAIMLSFAVIIVATRLVKPSAARFEASAADRPRARASRNFPGFAKPRQEMADVEPGAEFALSHAFGLRGRRRR